MNAMAAALFLSPHYDDVALSCGGTVALLADRGTDTTVVTIFGGEVIDDVLGDFARWKHSRWGLKDMDAVRVQRQAEDAAATATLGAGSRWLGFPDAIYRGDRYAADRELYGTVRTLEQPLAEVVSAEIQSLPEWRSGATVYVPLAAGEHVDHQLVFMAGQMLARGGARVLAYEDCPYAIHSPEGLDRRVAELAGALGPAELVPVGARIERRLAAIEAYSTQVPVIFRFTHDYRHSVLGFANRLLPEHGPVERFWPVLA
jgi:LmbE family N-acetylglucosaminyl deacetylase